MSDQSKHNKCCPPKCNPCCPPKCNPCSQPKCNQCSPPKSNPCCPPKCNQCCSPKCNQCCPPKPPCYIQTRCCPETKPECTSSDKESGPNQTQNQDKGPQTQEKTQSSQDGPGLSGQKKPNK
ncbi:sperm mitochondrial-associated cysteine-rich protein [Otolemur garnettii]|uniref:sperm mitochondrial-associated cysteine-rich protein n=1 Tax=Otolemur garnettii TaxID=30611 RepID=UPI000644292D|nr:sperm mitochondrial-associated cysteine-rich protein [Otolemur garnettii]